MKKTLQEADKTDRKKPIPVFPVASVGRANQNPHGKIAMWLVSKQTTEF